MASKVTKRDINENDIAELRKLYVEIYDKTQDPRTNATDFISYKKIMKNLKAIIGKVAR